MRTSPTGIRRMAVKGFIMMGGLFGLFLLVGAFSTDIASSPLSVPVAMEACPLDCVVCTTSGHKADTGGDKDAGGVEHAGCWPGNTCEAHGCDAEDNESEASTLLNLSDAWAVLVQAEPHELVVLVERYPQVVAFNHVRGAIQLLDCKGSVWAHMPVAPEVAALLERSVE